MRTVSHLRRVRLELKRVKEEQIMCTRELAALTADISAVAQQSSITKALHDGAIISMLSQLGAENQGAANPPYVLPVMTNPGGITVPGNSSGKRISSQAVQRTELNNLSETSNYPASPLRPVGNKSKEAATPISRGNTQAPQPSTPHIEQTREAKQVNPPRTFPTDENNTPRTILPSTARTAGTPPPNNSTIGVSSVW